MLIFGGVPTKSMRRVYLLIYINLHCLLICMVNVRLFELKILGGSSQLVSSWCFNSSYKPFRPFGREMLPYWDDPPSSLPCSSPFFSFLLLHLCFFRNMCCKNTWCFYTTCSFLYPTEQWKKPHCLGYIGDYNEPLSGSILNNQYFMESKGTREFSVARFIRQKVRCGRSESGMVTRRVLAGQPPPKPQK